MEKIESIKYNLSPLELLKPGYSKKLLRTIEEFDISFSYFQFEITETVATEYSEALYQTIADSENQEFKSVWTILDQGMRI